jgi:hypothetical protein
VHAARAVVGEASDVEPSARREGPARAGAVAAQPRGLRALAGLVRRLREQEAPDGGDRDGVAAAERRGVLAEGAERDRGLSPLAEDERELHGRLVGDVPALWSAPTTTMEDRKRLVRCLVHEVVLLRDDRRRATGGVSTVGLPWTYARVTNVRHHHGIPTACPIVPRGTGPRGDGLVSVGTVAAQLGVARSVVGRWCRCGFLAAEQKAARDPRWVRLTAEDLGRLDGTLAATGRGCWRLRDAQRELGLSEEELYRRVREGEVVAYRAHAGEHWEWRVRPADHQQPGLTPQTAGVHADGKDVH